MIIVTGANGQLGRGVVEQLLARIPADQIGLSVRDPERASAMAQRGVRVRRGDFAEPATLTEAFEGATQVLIVSVDDLGEVAVGRHAAAIEAARAAGVQRILYTSHMGARPDSPFAPAPDHAATEALLRDSGVPFTSLRNGFYVNTARMLLGQALRTGTLTAPEDGPVSWTAPADLAAAAAVVLTQEGELDGPTPPLAAPEAVDLTDLAAIASEAHGREISRVTVAEDEYRDSLVARGTPERFAEMFLGMFRASRRGAFTTDDPTLQRLIGHPPTRSATCSQARNQARFTDQDSQQPSPELGADCAGRRGRDIRAPGSCHRRVAVPLVCGTSSTEQRLLRNQAK